MGASEYNVALRSEHKQGLHDRQKHVMCPDCFPDVFHIEDQQEQYEALVNILNEMRRLGIIRITWDFMSKIEEHRNEIEIYMYDAQGNRTKAKFTKDFFQLYLND